MAAAMIAPTISSKAMGRAKRENNDRAFGAAGRSVFSDGEAPMISFRSDEPVVLASEEPD